MIKYNRQSHYHFVHFMPCNIKMADIPREVNEERLRRRKRAKRPWETGDKTRKVINLCIASPYSNYC